MASLLSLDITGAYDRVVRSRLVHVLRAKGIPEQLAEWMEVFIINRISILMLSNMKTEKRLIFVKVS